MSDVCVYNGGMIRPVPKWFEIYLLHQCRELLNNDGSLINLTHARHSISVRGFRINEGGA